MSIEDKIKSRIEELKEFEVEAAKSCNTDIMFIDWFEVSDGLFAKYGFDDGSPVSDKYYTGDVISAIINELSKLLNQSGEVK